ncbi:hypothetical protein [Escherichia coli]|uniref:hypothetical protein n=1 Tax=Escherichia coli TaxID=562 RepID=UPI003D9E2124
MWVFPWVSGSYRRPSCYSKPWMAFFWRVDCGHPVLFGAYQVLDAWIARVSRKSVRHWKPGNRP